MAREWKRGDVAMIPGVGRAIIADSNGKCNVARTDDPWRNIHSFSEVRPLVVIDPEDREQVEAICREYTTARLVRTGDDLASRMPTWDRVTTDMQAALRSLTEPSRPEVYEHFSPAHAWGEKNGSTKAVCGKVWKPGAEAAVVGKCPECIAAVEGGWTA